MSTSISNQMAFAQLQEMASQFLKAAAPLPTAKSENPYGTVTQTYQTEQASTETGSANYTLGSITPSTGSNTGIGRDTLAVANAIKAATPVTTAQGLTEISANAKASLTTALIDYFQPLVGGSFGITKVSGGISYTGLKADIATAIQNFTSGADHGAFSMTLAATKTSQEADWPSSSSNPSPLAPTMYAQGVTITRTHMAIAISISQDGKVSGSYSRHDLYFDQGTVVEQGHKGAVVTLTPGEKFFSSFNTNTTSLIPTSFALEPGGGSETDALSVSYNEKSATHYQPPSANGSSPGIENITTTASGTLAQSMSFDQNGFTLAAKAALATLTSIADAGLNKQATLIIGLVANTTVAVGLTNPDGSSSFVYPRPNGTIGRIDFGAVNQLA